MAITFQFGQVTGLGANGGTTGNHDTLSSDLLYVAFCYYIGASGSTLTDNQSGNTYTLVASTSVNSELVLASYYCVLGAKSATHTFTVTGNATYTAIGVMGFAGSHATPFDTHVADTTNFAVNSFALGTITPANADSLLVSALTTNFSTSGTPTLSDAYTVAGHQQYNSGNYYPLALAYQIETGTQARTPTWSWTSTAAWNAVQAVFKPAAGGGGGPTLGTRRLLSGVGR